MPLAWTVARLRDFDLRHGALRGVARAPSNTPILRCKKVHIPFRYRLPAGIRE